MQECPNDSQIKITILFNNVTLPGDCHVALLLAMTLSALRGIEKERTSITPLFVRNKIFPFRTKYSVIAKHRFAVLWQSPGRDTALQNPRKILLYLRGEKKAQTSIRVSIIACNNVISKAQCAPWASYG